MTQNNQTSGDAAGNAEKNSTLDEQSGAVGAQNDLGGGKGRTAGTGRQSFDSNADQVGQGGLDEAGHGGEEATTERQGFQSSIGGLSSQNSDAGTASEGADADEAAGRRGDSAADAARGPR